MDGRRLLIALTLMPMAAAVFAAWRPAVPSAVASTGPLAPLAFDQYLVNLREAPLRPVFWGDYHFTNVGDVPLTITELKPSCGCLQPQLAGEKRTYQPGERGMFRVQVATANESPGPHAYDVRVKYTAPEAQEALVRFKLILPDRKLSVDPPELAFFQYNGQPSSRVIHLTDFRDDQLVVQDVTSSSELVTAVIQPAETDEAGHHRVPIELSVPGVVPAGRHVETVKILTSDPEFAIIRIPVLIDGPKNIQMIGHEVPAGSMGPAPPGDALSAPGDSAAAPDP